DIEETLLFFLVIVGRRGRQHACRQRTAFALWLFGEHACAQYGQVHDLEFETLARVDCHQADRVNALDRRRWLTKRALVAEDLKAPHPVEQVSFRVAIIYRVVLDGELK